MSDSVSECVSQWQGHLLSCCGQLKRAQIFRYMSFYNLVFKYQWLIYLDLDFTKITDNIKQKKKILEMEEYNVIKQRCSVLDIYIYLDPHLVKKCFDNTSDWLQPIWLLFLSCSVDKHALLYLPTLIVLMFHFPCICLLLFCCFVFLVYGSFSPGQRKMSKMWHFFIFEALLWPNGLIFSSFLVVANIDLSFKML